MGFYPRSITPIIFVKAMFFHSLQKKSWRSIWVLLATNHVALHSFYSNYHNRKEIKKIFHYFAEAKVIVFIGDSKQFSIDEIDNKDIFYKLTIDKLESIFR